MARKARKKENRWMQKAVKPKNRGKFTAAAKKRGLTAQQFARKVLNNPGSYSELMRQRAQFARTAGKISRKNRA